MPSRDQESLADRRQLVVVLRLVAATTGRLLYGEVIDARTGPTSRFVGWNGMTPAVRVWVQRELDEAVLAELLPLTYEPKTPVER